MEPTKFCSWKSGGLSEGCAMCVQGKKLVLFVTGICSRDCWYCPLSDAKKNLDVVFANEWKTSGIKDIIREAELCEAEGAGITGGDPLLRVERCVEYIKALKARFGKKFHIHMYITLEHATPDNLKLLYDAGLDEIRIHPDLESGKYWERIKTIASFGWVVGMEIPVIPQLGNETEKAIDYFLPFIKFLNLNELEQSDTNMDEMAKRGLKAKSMLDYSVEGSHELALMLGAKYESRIPVHYCTTRLKDAVQMANRIKIRAKNAAEKFDIITDEGLLVRGSVYLDSLKPGFGYRRILESMNDKERSDALLKLKQARELILKKYRLSSSVLKIDEKKMRLITSAKIAKKIKEEGLSAAIVTEYPTWDATEIEVEFL